MAVKDGEVYRPGDKFYVIWGGEVKRYEIDANNSPQLVGLGMIHEPLEKS